MPHVWSARFRTDRSPRAWLGGGIGVGVALLVCRVGAAGGAGDDDIPELLPPLDVNPAATGPLLIDPTRAPIVSTPANPRPLPDAGRLVLPGSPAETIVPAPTPPGQVNAVLAVPGMGGPNAPRRGGLPAVAAPVASWGAPDPPPAAPADRVAEPTLNGPMEMPDIAALPHSAGMAGHDDAFDPISGRPVTIPEPVIEEQLPAGTARNARSPRERAADRVPTREPVPAATAAPRRGRFFGLFPAPLAVPPSTLVARSTTGPKASARATDDADPKALAAQAALKARIEKQARTYVGDRARTIEVQLDQRDAVIRARGVSLFQKRAVRRTIESLPALSGLRTTIEVDN